MLYYDARTLEPVNHRPRSGCNCLDARAKNSLFTPRRAGGAAHEISLFFTRGDHEHSRARVLRGGSAQPENALPGYSSTSTVVYPHPIKYPVLYRLEYQVLYRPRPVQYWVRAPCRIGGLQSAPNCDQRHLPTYQDWLPPPENALNRQVCGLTYLSRPLTRSE